jgi:Protein of unknown function (DUF2783)
MAAVDTRSSLLADPDEAYRVIIEAHRGLSDDDSVALNARLVLVLANCVGDIDTLRSAVALAVAKPDAGSRE